MTCNSSELHLVLIEQCSLEQVKHAMRLQIIMLILCLPLPLSAVSVYQWTDEQGVTHFSDEAPVNDNAGKPVSSFEVEEAYPQTRDPEEDYYSISNQWQRANDDRMAREKLKLERDKIRASRSNQAPVIHVASEEPQRRYYPVFSPAYNRFLPGRILNNPGHPFSAQRFPHHNNTNKMDSTPAPVSRGYVGNVAGSQPTGN